MEPPIQLRLSIVGREGVGKKTAVTIYGRRNDPAFGGALEGSTLVSNVTCNVKLNNVPVIVRLDALSDWADVSQIQTLMQSHRVILAFDLFNDSQFEGAGDLTRLINQLAVTRRSKIQFDILGTKADMCHQSGAGLVLARVAPFLKNSGRFAVSSEANGDSIVEAINKIVLSVHTQLMAASAGDPSAKTLRLSNGHAPLKPPATNGSYQTPPSLMASQELDNPDAFAPLAPGVYPQLPVVMGAPRDRGPLEPLILENNSLDQDPELDHPVSCASCLQS